MPVWPASPALLLVPSAALLNLVLTFWGTLLLALLAARCAPSHAMRKLLLLLPLAKLAADACAGIPADNYALSAFAGTRWELGRFGAGVGWNAAAQLVPELNFQLEALRSGRWHSLSGGDLLAHALYRRHAWPLLVALLVAIGTVAALRLYRRGRAWRRFHRDLPLTGPALRLGRIAVRRSPGRAGDAFTAGVFRPTIWLPERGSGLRPAELRAILRHELAHVRHGDVTLFALLGVVSDLLWFVPGMQLLTRRIHDAAERAADSAAVRAGADPVALASALVAVAERRSLAGAVANAAGASGVEGRIRALLDRHERPPAARLALALLSLSLALVALQSSFFGFR
jgi:BlaR1 peptidase M56